MKTIRWLGSLIAILGVATPNNALAISLLKTDLTAPEVSKTVQQLQDKTMPLQEGVFSTPSQLCNDCTTLTDPLLKPVEETIIDLNETTLSIIKEVDEALPLSLNTPPALEEPSNSSHQVTAGIDSTMPTKLAGGLNLTAEQLGAATGTITAPAEAVPHPDGVSDEVKTLSLISLLSLALFRRSLFMKFLKHKHKLLAFIKLPLFTS